MPKVSVIIVNYNGNGIITGCLKGLEAQSFKDFEALVVDNGSLDDSLYEIKAFLKETAIAPLVKLISLNKNLGFAGGNLEGLKQACGEYIGLLNSDTEADERWLGELVMAMDNDPGVGICASKLIVYGTDMIDSAGDGFSTSLKGFKRGEGGKIFLYGKKEYIFGACAGAALYRRKMIEEIGFLDEDFFLIHEDTDLNFRAQLHGWKVLYVPTALVSHKVRSSIGNMSDMAFYYALRNSEWVRIKNIPISLFLNCIVTFILGVISDFLYFAVKYRRMPLYFKAKYDAVKMLPNMMKKRRANLRGMRVDSGYLRKMMNPVFGKNCFRGKLKKFILG
jgi:GT2 family glycosyltransferase